MKVTEKGTINVIEWYQPESSEECKSIDCRRCVYYSYVPSNSSCPFEAWMINHPIKELSIQEIVAAAKRHGFGEPSSSTSNIVMVLNEINQNIIKSIELQQEQPAQEDQSNIPLWFMPSMENANDYMHGRDYYHHCPQKNYKLVRLNYLPNHKEHLCPICKQTFVMK